jgi:hypothetical protein
MGKFALFVVDFLSDFLESKAQILPGFGHNALQPYDQSGY